MIEPGNILVVEDEGLKKPMYVKAENVFHVKELDEDYILGREFDPATGDVAEYGLIEAWEHEVTPYSMEGANI